MPRLDRRRSNPRPANIIAQRVKEKRIEQGLSQASCAQNVQTQLNALYPDLRFDLDQSDISRLENGKRPVWDYELRAIAVVLATTADYLLGLETQ